MNTPDARRRREEKERRRKKRKEGTRVQLSEIKTKAAKAS